MEDDMGQGLSVEVEGWLNKHLASVRSKILEEAKRRSKEKGSAEPVMPIDVADAAKLYAPGEKFSPEARVSFWSRIGESISGITLVSAVLAVIFGAIGLSSQAGAGWVDIAKIFAGAVVGSAGVSTVAVVRGRSTS